MVFTCCAAGLHDISYHFFIFWHDIKSNFDGLEGSQRRKRSGYCKEGLNAFEVKSTDAKSPRKKEANEDRKVQSSLSRKHFISHSCIKSHHGALRQIMLCFRLSKMEASLLVILLPSRSIFHFSAVPIEKKMQKSWANSCNRNTSEGLDIVQSQSCERTATNTTECNPCLAREPQQTQQQKQEQMLDNYTQWKAKLMMTNTKQRKTTRRHDNLCVSFL